MAKPEFMVAHLNMLIGARTLGKVLTDREANLKEAESEKGLYFSHFIGSKDLKRSYNQKRPILVRRKVGSKRNVLGIVRPVFDYEKKGETTGWTNVSRDMSLTLSISEREVKDLVMPLLEQGARSIWIYTLWNSYGLSNSFNVPSLVGYGNKWVVSASRPASPDFRYVNGRLKALGSAWRVLAEGVNIVKVRGRNLW